MNASTAVGDILRSDPTNATASIVGFAAVPVPTLYKAGGPIKWRKVQIRPL